MCLRCVRNSRYVSWRKSSCKFEAAGTHDLTVTTSSTAKVGDTVLVNGPLTLDKDFGYGYQYNVIIEDASVTVE